MRPGFPSTVPGLSLPSARTTGTWYRAIQTHFLSSALSTQHTRTIPSRFYDPNSSSSQFDVLYLAENPLVALLEVQALLGTPTTPGGVVPHPRSSWTILNVTVSLSLVADLTSATAQSHLQVTAQELTGDWRGYRLRGPHTTVQHPTGTAPTQELGDALFNDPRDIEAFRTLSAKVPYHEILVVFPQHLKQGSNVSWFNPSTGATESVLSS